MIDERGAIERAMRTVPTGAGIVDRVYDRRHGSGASGGSKPGRSRCS